jgi:uncharacterized Fe-S cluster-containing radical SAM superfamily protein
MALNAAWDGGPGICHFAITSACNARWGFCSFARDQLPAAARHCVSLAEAKLACDILKRNGIGFVHFTGGEPLVQPDFTAVLAHAAQTGMIITNGALLTEKRVDALAEAGLASVSISIDAVSHAVHDSNRGLPGLSARIRRANTALKRHLRGEPERFGCITGWKFFYLDWHLQLWRSYNWNSPACDIREFDETQARARRLHCLYDCCYRNDSVMQHVAELQKPGCVCRKPRPG